MFEEDYVILRRRVAEPSKSIEDVYGKPYAADASRMDHVDFEQTSLSAKELDKLRRQDDVIGAAPIMPLRHISPLVRKLSPILSNQVKVPWGLDAVKGNETELSGSGSVVAVLDTGIDRNHGAFSHLAERIEQENFTDEADEDLDGHGTHCAGTIFGGTVGGIQVGLAPGIQKALVGKVIGSSGCDTAGIHRALQWAVDNGANIISLSLGFDFAKYADSLTERWPRDVAYSKAMLAYHENLELFGFFAQHMVSQRIQPVLLVAATGNEARRNEHAEHLIAKSLPASAPGFLAVGAVQRNDSNFQVAPFSNTGARVCAPGVDILSAVPGGKFAEMSGTSMAVPHVSGVAALWLEWLNRKYQNVSGQLLLDKIIGSATDERITDASERDTGAGIILAP